MEVHAPGDDDRRPPAVRDRGEGHRRHRHRVRVVGVDEVGREVADDPREAERRGEIDFVGRRQADEIVAFARAPRQFALRVRHEHRPVAARPEADDGQEDLVLSPAPRAGGVDMEAEHLFSRQ